MRGITRPIIVALIGAVFAACDGQSPVTAPGEPTTQPTTQPTTRPAASGVGGAPETAAAKVVGERDAAPLYRKQLLSNVYHVDRIFKSMMGPMSRFEFHLWRSPEPELLWVTGFDAVMAAPDGVEQLSQEFMCHSNLDVDEDRYHKTIQTKMKFTAGRVFTISQGQHEVRFPSGCGVPLPSDQSLSLVTQVLNHNITGRTILVRHRVGIEFVRDLDLKQPLKPLVGHAVHGMKLVEGGRGYFGIPSRLVDAHKHGEACSIGDPVDTHHNEDDGTGQTFTGFWYVKPGREVNHTRVTQQLDLPYDTTIHYAMVHLHPYAESLELRDLTTGQTVYKSKTRQVEDGGIGLAEVEYYSSEEGLPLYKRHEYQLISVYNNTSGVDQDSMAIMLLYVHAKDYSPRSMALSDASRKIPSGGQSN